jgi:hypothetical protein
MHTEELKGAETMKMFTLGLLLGCLITAFAAWAQNPDIYGRPQWGKQITPPSDAYGRPNFPAQQGLKKHDKPDNPC